MEMIPVTSSNLAAVGYDQESFLLKVQFNNGRIYEYYSVSKEVHEGLMNAPSKGTYFYERIQNGGYSYNEIT